MAGECHGLHCRSPKMRLLSRCDSRIGLFITLGRIWYLRLHCAVGIVSGDRRATVAFAEFTDQE